MAAFGYHSELHFDQVTQLEAPQATQSAPASRSSSFRDLIRQYIDPEITHHVAPRRCSEGNRPSCMSPTAPRSLVFTTYPSSIVDKTNEPSSSLFTRAKVGKWHPTESRLSLPTIESSCKKRTVRDTCQSPSLPPEPSVEQLFTYSERLSTTPSTQLGTSSAKLICVEPSPCSDNIAAKASSPKISIMGTRDVVSATTRTQPDHKLERRTSPDMQEMSPFPEAQLYKSQSSTTTEIRELIPVPDTPLGISQLQFGSQVSFNTSVRDLIQESPDTPIGGKLSPPLEHPILIVSPKQPLTPITNRFEQPSSPDHVRGASVSSRHPSISSSGGSDEMITAPETPSNRRIDRSTNLSYDGASSDMPHIGTDVRDFAFNPAQSSALQHECCVSPGTTTPRDTSGCIVPNAHNKINVLDGFFSEKRTPAGNNPPKREKEPKKSDMKKEENFKHGSEKKHDMKSKAQLKGSHQPLQPLEFSGESLIPATPLAAGNGKSKGPLHRRIRGKILITPVLSIVIGRQLARPARSVLKQAAQTVPDGGAVKSVAPIPL
jgi:hypothetical protein